MRKTFAPHRLAQKDILQDAHPPLRLRPAPLQPRELPGAASLRQLLGRTRTDSIIDPILRQADPVALAVETTVRRCGLEFGAIDFLHPSHALAQEERVRRSA